MEFLIIGGAVILLATLGKKPEAIQAKVPKAEEEAGLPPGTYKASDVIRKIVSPPPGQPTTGVYLPPKTVIEKEPGVIEKIVKPAGIEKDIVMSEVGMTEAYFTGTKKILKV